MKLCKWVCLIICFLISLSSVSCSSDIVPKIITVEVKEISDLPEWYQNNQNLIAVDIKERYHHQTNSNNTVRYLVVDSFDKKMNLMVESTRQSIKLFLKDKKNPNLIDSNAKGIMAIHWSNNGKYFSYQNVTNMINDDIILGTLYLSEIGKNINDIKKFKLIDNISISDATWDKQDKMFVFTNYEKLYIYLPESEKIYEIKDKWSRRPSGHPQVIDNISFSDDGVNLIFRYCGYYEGDKYEFYQINCSEIK